MNYKEKLLEKLRENIASIQEKIFEKLESVKLLNDKNLKQIGSLKGEEREIQMATKIRLDERFEELNHLFKTPYFAKCEFIQTQTGEKKNYYFAKHQLVEESIYSWVAPIAAIRFENPGQASYKIPNGKIMEVNILHKEQYMIVDGKVIFFSVEELDKPRDLIYQENFTSKKAGFILPEIVAQMEKAQDQVIRAFHKGPLVISGPAGSGKTTLALHRVAYLTQAPETLSLYPTDSIMVLVQDSGTKEYFSHLLPELGIHRVNITTFQEWAFSILGLEGYSYVSRYGSSEEERDIHEYQKIKALRMETTPSFNDNYFRVLNSVYKKHINTGLFEKQKKEMKLDRFDITILLQAYLKKYNKFVIKRKYLTMVNGEVKQKVEKKSVLYSLIILDEFQNYLPEQVKILRSCLQEETQSMVYVGDMAQQVHLGTIKDWDEAGEDIKEERKIKLEKVYRNTKSILLFIESLGYPTVIPLGIKEGVPVVEKLLENKTKEIEYIKSVIDPYKEGTVGVIAKDPAYLEDFKKEFFEHKNIHVLTMNESQGVEFDLVCLVGINEDAFKVVHYEDVLPEHLVERNRMQKDLLYVALTRAISELHVLGTKKLKEIL
ncbi:MAG: AAA family ATPase [Simkania sp.]|nr:AAA family ATPase [Simkania sp.]